MMEWMIDTFWAASALILLILIIRRPVAAYFGPIIAYYLWIIPAARVFMPSLTKTENNIASDAVHNITASHQSGNLVNSTSAISLDNANDIASISNISAFSIDTLMVSFLIWGSVAMVIFIVHMGRYLSFRDELRDNSDEIGCQEGVTLIQSDRVNGPFAFGIFKKYIAVPMDFNKIFAPEMREMAIAHEMTHHRNYDLIINLGAFIFLCLTWFSPLSWYAWGKFRTDQESACDARVLKGADQETKHIYGKAIARGACKEASTFLAAMSSPKTILTRLRRLKMPPISKSRSFFGRLSILTVTAIALPLTATTISVANEINMDGKKDQHSMLESNVSNLIKQDAIEKQEAELENSVKEPPSEILETDKDTEENTIEKLDYHINDDGEKEYYTNHYKHELKFEHSDIKFAINSDDKLSQEKIDTIISDAKIAIDKLLPEVSEDRRKHKQVHIYLHSSHANHDSSVKYWVGNRYLDIENGKSKKGTIIIAPLNDEVNTTHILFEEDIIDKNGEIKRLAFTNKDYEYLGDCNSHYAPEKCERKNEQLIEIYKKEGLVLTFFSIQAKIDLLEYDKEISAEKKNKVRERLEEQREILRDLINAEKKTPDLDPLKS